MSAPLTKEQLLGMPVGKTTEHEVPGWGSVRLRYLSGLDRAELERMSNGTLDPLRFRQRLLAMSLANDDGSPMFDDAEAKVLMQKQGTAIDNLCEVIMELNEIGGDSVEDAKK